MIYPVQNATFTIRRADEADAETIARAHVHSIHSTGAFFYSPKVVADWSARLQPDLYRQAMADGEVFFIAIDDSTGPVLGFSSHRIEDGQHRTAVYVRGDTSRQGIGTALFREAEAVARAAGAKEIHVAASLAAIEFYRANGFEEMRRGEHLLWSGRPMACVFMRKTIRL